jgi:hypothetical protein
MNAPPGIGAASARCETRRMQHVSLRLVATAMERLCRDDS